MSRKIENDIFDLKSERGFHGFLKENCYTKQKKKKERSLRVYNTLLTLTLQAFFFELCPQGDAKKTRSFFPKKKNAERSFFFTFSKCTFFL